VKLNKKWDREDDVGKIIFWKVINNSVIARSEETWQSRKMKEIFVDFID